MQLVNTDLNFCSHFCDQMVFVECNLVISIYEFKYN